MPVGATADVYVLALNAAGRIMPNYVGEIGFWNADAQATLPGPYTFRPGDYGVAAFPAGVTFRTPGVQELYVFDTATFTVFGYAVFEVTAAASATGRAARAPDPFTAATLRGRAAVAAAGADSVGLAGRARPPAPIDAGASPAPAPAAPARAGARIQAGRAAREALDLLFARAEGPGL